MLQTGAIVRGWLPGADLRNSHDGLKLLIKKELSINVDKDLKLGECVMCINTNWSAFKILFRDNILLHYKHPEGHRLNARAILSVPRFMKGTQINYEKALRHEIIKLRYPHKDPKEIEAELSQS
jgi:hypothetical protein